jgi:iron complex outermembrane receptor protein
VPVVRKYLEFQFAVRREKYSDFGKTTKPKFSFVSQPFDFLKLRASYSQSFKAPDLGQLYTSRTIAFTSTTYTDPLRPTDPATQLRIITGGNPLLQPENGKIWYGGAVLDFEKMLKPLKGLTLSVDWFNFTIKDVITSYTSPNTLFVYFPNRVIRDNSGGYPGPIQYLEATPNNVAGYYYRGLDIGLDYTLRGTRLGDFNFGVQATRINYYGYDSGLGGGPINYVGTYNTPRWTANAQIGWRYRKYGATISSIYKGPYKNDGYTLTTWGENPIAKINLSLSYEGPWRTKFIVAVDNLLDKNPPVNGRETSSFDQATYAQWAMGRFVSFRVTKEF